MSTFAIFRSATVVRPACRWPFLNTPSHRTGPVTVSEAIDELLRGNFPAPLPGASDADWAYLRDVDIAEKRFLTYQHLERLPGTLRDHLEEDQRRGDGRITLVDFERLLLRIRTPSPITLADFERMLLRIGLDPSAWRAQRLQYETGGTTWPPRGGRALERSPTLSATRRRVGSSREPGGSDAAGNAEIPQPGGAQLPSAEPAADGAPLST